MRLRRLGPADAAAHRALMLEAYAREPDAFTSTVGEREALPLAWWAARMAEGDAPGEMVFGAFDGPQLAGAAGIRFETREKLRHKALLFGMSVRPPYRGRGVGAALVDAVLAAAHARPGVALVQLTVSAGNTAAEALYARAGFRSFGVEPMAVAAGAGFVDKVHLWLPLARDNPAAGGRL